VQELAKQYAEQRLFPPNFNSYSGKSLEQQWIYYLTANLPGNAEPEEKLSQANISDTAPIVVIGFLYLLIMGFGFLARKR